MDSIITWEKWENLLYASIRALLKLVNLSSQNKNPESKLSFPANGIDINPNFYLTACFLLYFDLLTNRLSGTLSAEDKEDYDWLKDMFIKLQEQCLIDLTLEMAKKGNTKLLNLIFESMGPLALDSDIVRDGIKILLCQGKTVQLSVSHIGWEISKKYAKLTLQMAKFLKKSFLENNMTIATSYFDEPTSTIKTRFYRDFPKLQKSSILTTLSWINEMETKMSEPGFNPKEDDFFRFFETFFPQVLKNFEMSFIRDVVISSENWRKFIQNFNITKYSLFESISGQSYTKGGKFTRLPQKQ